jgi:uncharacterized protein YcbK (DUF882 family)
MSAICENTTPLASRFDSSILRLDSGAFSDIIDITKLADTNPVEKVNRQSLVDVTKKTNAILGGLDLSNYDTLRDRYEQAPLSFVDIADFVVDNNYSITDLDDDIKNYNPFNPTEVVPVPVDSYLTDLDYHLNKNLGKSISAGMCGAFANVFGQLTALFILIDTASELMGDIKNLLEKDPLKKIKAITLNQVITKIKDLVLEIIDKVVEQLLKQIEKAVTATVGALNDIHGTGQKAFKKIQETAEDIKELFSEEGIKDFKKKVEAFLAKTSAQFERLTVENVALLMFRFCQLTEVIQGLLKGPVDGLKALSSAMVAEHAVLSALSLRETEKAVKAGAIRIDPKERRDAKTKAQETVNASAPTIKEVVADASIQSNYITPSELSQVEIKTISDNRTEAGVPGKFTYTSAVINQNDYEGKELKGAGYKKIDPVVLGKLLRICEQTGQSYVINSGYRSPVKNKKVGGAKLSQHMTGKAIDVRVKGSYEDRAEFVVAASRAGFTGIGVYSSFIHLDIRDHRVSWVGGERNTPSDYPVPDSQLSKWVAHVDKHDKDLFRTKTA